MAKNSAPGGCTTVVRKFGINETYQLAMYLLDQYRGTILSCRFAIPPRLAPAESRTQLEETVKVAVADLIMRHPMLQVGIVDANSKTPSWVQLQSLDLTEHIKWLYLPENADFERIVQEIFCAQLDDRFPDLSMKQPGWKLTFIRQGTAPVMEALLTWNHPQFDGAGARVFHEDLLELLNADNRIHERPGLDGDVLALPQAPPMLPAPIEVLRSLPVDLKHLIKAFWDETRPQFLNRDISLATWCPIRPSEPYKTQFRSFFVHSTSLTTLLALCRTHHTTITALLNALALLAFASRLDAPTAPAFQSSTIIDHRRNLPPAPPTAPWGPSDRAISNYVTQCQHRWDANLVSRIRGLLPAANTTGSSERHDGRLLSTDLVRELWAVAAQNRREIAAKLDAGLRNDLVGLFKYVTDWRKTMSGIARRPRQFAWLVTNIGVLDGGGKLDASGAESEARGGDGPEKWAISRAQFGLGAEVPFAVIEFSPVSVKGGTMCVAASWTDCAVDVKFGEGVMADMERWLGQLAGERAV